MCTEFARRRCIIAFLWSSFLLVALQRKLAEHIVYSVDLALWTRRYVFAPLLPLSLSLLSRFCENHLSKGSRTARALDLRLRIREAVDRETCWASRPQNQSFARNECFDQRENGVLLSSHRMHSPIYQCYFSKHLHLFAVIVGYVNAWI